MKDFARVKCVTMSDMSRTWCRFCGSPVGVKNLMACVACSHYDTGEALGYTPEEYDTMQFVIFDSRHFGKSSTRTAILARHQQESI